MEGRNGGIAGTPADPEDREDQDGRVDTDDDRGASEGEDTGGDIEDEEAQAMIEVVGIDHVQLSMPPGGEDMARAFYVEILGLREIAKPPKLAGRGGCWFVGADAAIHVAPEAGFRPHAKAHPALVIRDLERARTELLAADVAIEEDDAGLPVSRCYIRDPFGNRIELDDERDAGFSTV